jgi:hypothetical protein
MQHLRLPFFILSALCLLVVIALELGEGLGARLLSDAGQNAPPHPSGLGIPCLAFLDGLVLFTIALMGAAMIWGNTLQAEVQGIVTLVVSILVLLGGIVAALAAVVLLLLMVALFLAVPFGTLAYLALYGDFATGAAQAVLGATMALKILAGIFLILAHQRFLQNKGLVFIILTSLVANLVVSFLQNLVPLPLVSITDALAGIIVVVIALIWALVFALTSLPSILKAVNVTKAV